MSNPGDEYLWTGRAIDGKQHAELMKRFERAFSRRTARLAAVGAVIGGIIGSIVVWVLLSSS